MTYWARLTWQVPDPDAAAVALARRLGTGSVPGGLVPGARLVLLGSAALELRPWQREAPGDRPRASGRLVYEPVPGGEPPPAVVSAAGSPMVLIGVGWATVDLDRAEAELDPWLAPPDVERIATDAWTGVTHGLEEPHLGARARVRGAGGLPAGHVVLLEPTTEGRLAASLARDGEGPCALYLEPAEGFVAWRAAARARGLPMSTVRRGPLGDAVLVIGGAVAGPHLLVVDPSGPVIGTLAGGTIAP
jgi:hypothetical protein